MLLQNLCNTRTSTINCISFPFPRPNTCWSRRSNEARYLAGCTLHTELLENAQHSESDIALPRDKDNVCFLRNEVLGEICTTAVDPTPSLHEVGGTQKTFNVKPLKNKTDHAGETMTATSRGEASSYSTTVTAMRRR